MSIPLPNVRDIPGFLGMPMVGGSLDLPPEAPSAASARDAGYFGPGSVTWKVMREPLLGVGGVRALLLQVAHPLVAAGARHHSFYKEDPAKRLKETGLWVARVVYGTRAQADWACREVNIKHHQVRGTLEPEAATAHVPANTEYAAKQRDLARWVHATLVDTLLVSYEALVRPLSPTNADRFVEEWNVIGRKMGMRVDDEFHSRRELTAYINDQIENGPVSVGAGSMEVAETILHPDFGAPQAAWNRVLTIPLGLMPPKLREQYGVRWTALNELEFRAASTGMKTARAAMVVGTAHMPGARRFHEANRWNALDPRRLRSSSAYDMALRQATETLGQLDAA